MTAGREKAYQKTISEALEMFGYEGTHVYPLRDMHGVYRTPTTSPGWPDLVYLRAPRLLAIEVKDDGVTVPPHQRAWLTLFASIPCARAWVARPSDPPWPVLVGWMKHPKDSPHQYGFEPVDDPSQVLAEHKRKKRQKKTTKRRPR